MDSFVDVKVCTLCQGLFDCTIYLGTSFMLVPLLLRCSCSVWVLCVASAKDYSLYALALTVFDGRCSCSVMTVPIIASL
jgi:hypothetical protein